ncbi:MAG: dTDP-4-dehydrorhamnose 3,5-epimerase family protein [Candidatus Omnitrophica bacterium]|nr:dTDP-4-dehydrorhamnose 3,5-epimerase family protein [Candidatus Omnitrophota bacterium]
MSSEQIEGVVIKELRKISDERGCIFHMLRRDEPEFEEFGEIYFSMVKPGAVKAWHLHKQMILNYAVICGDIKLVLYDDRTVSSTKGKVFELETGENNYCLIKIPPGIWNGFCGLGNKPSIVANCASLAHDPNEIIRIDPYSNQIPYKWQKSNG